MARRRGIELPAGARPFERDVADWRDLGAPAWVYDLPAAVMAYVAWARPGYGRGADLSDGVIGRYYVAMQWLPHCVQPRYLDHVGALTAGEAQLLANDRSARWGRPGRCRTPMLDPKADVPVWLACCRQEPRHGSA
jgi:hypothetical protein